MHSEDPFSTYERRAALVTCETGCFRGRRLGLWHRLWQGLSGAEF